MYIYTPPFPQVFPEQWIKLLLRFEDRLLEVEGKKGGRPVRPVRNSICSTTSSILTGLTGLEGYAPLPYRAANQWREMFDGVVSTKSPHL
jgi:hypothetical protein